MTSLAQAPFTGNLLAWHRGTPCNWTALPGITKRPLEPNGWSHVALESSKALLNDEQPDTTCYVYNYLLRESGDRFLVLSSRWELIEPLIQTVGKREVLVSPLVDIPRLTTEIAKKPGRYALAAVYAKVDGFGQALRSVALYGSDLGEAKLFIDLLPQIVPYRVHLRDVRSALEVLSIGSRGEVAFFYRNIQSLRDADAALGFLRHSGYLTWPVDHVAALNWEQTS